MVLFLFSGFPELINSGAETPNLYFETNFGLSPRAKQITYC